MKLQLVSSLNKVFLDQKPDTMQETHITLLKNQRGAFQVAYFGEETEEFYLKIQGLPRLNAYAVTNIQSSYPCHETVDEGYLRTEPGLYPDLLKPLDLDLPLTAEKDCWQAVWISFSDLTPGSYEVTAEAKGQVLSLSLTVKDTLLPPQTLYHTQWFHGDCLADYYGVEVFSEDHWTAIEGFLEGAAHCGVNMILTPLFTPPLDTAQGGQRTTIQLVDVSYFMGIYHFDFGKLRRWVGLCKKHGIQELEFSHLFTQWGAAAAPKVMVKEYGVLRQKFGWDSQAAGGEYTRFLRQFLPKLQKELRRMGMWEHSWFHISDEPSEGQLDSYRAAKESIGDLLPEQRCIDALSSFDFYKLGIVKRPVVAEDHLEPFLKAGVQGLFTYYCTAQGLQVPNRFFSMPSGRNRILGVLLYKFDLAGFLHWGLNFYNSQYSMQHIDPFLVSDAGGAFPSGDPYLLYPAPDGSAWPSIRSEVLYEGLQDLRLLQLAERKLGREQVLGLLQDIAGYDMDFTHYPVEEGFFWNLQKALMEVI